MRADRIAVLAGLFGLAMVLGAVFFQFVIGVSPCEVCFWQRYPHAAAAAIGLIGAGLAWAGVLDAKKMRIVAGLALFCLLVAGCLGVYHSGVEWKWWAGPSACTGDRYVITGAIDLNTPSVVRCDIVSWYFLGILSLANLNVIFSLGAAALGALCLRDETLLRRLYDRVRK